MPILPLLTNISFILALLLGPVLLLVASWQRKNMQGVIMRWHRPESMILTIVFSVLASVLFIVGTTCLFNYLRLREVQGFTTVPLDKFKEGALASFFLLLAVSQAFISLRSLMMQVVTHEGIVYTSPILYLPDFTRVIKWEQIVDYYTSLDYPNTKFTLVYQVEGGEFERIVVGCPAYQKAHFAYLLDQQLDYGEVYIDNFRQNSKKYSGK